MARFAMLLVAVAALMVAHGVQAAKFIDQHTDESASTRDMTHGKIWQSFKTGWNSSLIQIDVLVGSSSPCFEMVGTLHVIKGLPQSWTDFSDDIDDNGTVTHQEVRTTCKKPDSTPIACSEGDCLAWQTFPLAAPIAVGMGEVYSFALTGFYSEDKISVGRIGVSPDSENHGGKSSLLISPKYKTKYTQFTFRTWMDTKAPENLYQQVSTTDEPVLAEKSNSSGVSPASIVVPIFVVLAVVALVLFVVKIRRNWRQERVHILGSKYMVEPINDDTHSIRSDSSDLSARRPGGQKRPIHVRSADKDDSYSTWADTVSMSSEAPMPDLPAPSRKKQGTPATAMDEWAWNESSTRADGVSLEDESNSFSNGFMV